MHTHILTHKEKNKGGGGGVVNSYMTPSSVKQPSNPEIQVTNPSSLSPASYSPDILSTKDCDF